MGRASKKMADEDGARDIPKTSEQSATAASEHDKFDRLYHSIAKSAKNERGKKMRLEKAAVRELSFIFV
ncbi:unnamed protein product [Gongylonema pulchrum]|uniref:CaM_binding domain-containing protein n=1 Tax=Gongylonema pulchrum TaxID=637853 RepID=A0A183EYG9_9BILA|nr:unnamed protein product [Gongylonema pulchrum]